LYTGKANWDIIRDVKETVSIPVIGNGDVFSPADAKHPLEHAGCDSIMIGCAACKGLIMEETVATEEVATRHSNRSVKQVYLWN
jgi:tRNA-dihydrouridine synthase